ncbi:MAG: YdcF family protein [Cytophagaceae bacterium]|nr:YdcF family protein [Cytophagaceae bacterium]
MKFLKYLLLFFLSWFTIHTMLICLDGLIDDEISADVALILGNKVEENGEMSARLKGRMNKGLQLYKTKKVKKIVVSGGKGKEGYYEAEVMKEFLIKNNIPASDVITDNAGNTSYETAANYVKIHKENSFQSVIVVSQFFHISRCKLALQKMGITYVYGAHAEYYEMLDLYSLVREFFA